MGGRLAEFQRNWEAVIREWSLRWGKSVSGWWIDGCYFADQVYRFDDEPNFASFARALKAGNSEAIVAFNPGVRVPVIVHTRYDDYTAGEVNLPKLAKTIESCPGRWLECEGRKVQFHILSFLGKSWCRGDRPQLPDEQIVAYTRQVADKGGVITYDVPIQKSGLIPEPFVEQLRAIGAAVVVKPAEPTSKPFEDGTFSWKASGPLILPNPRTADPAILDQGPYHRTRRRPLAPVLYGTDDGLVENRIVEAASHEKSHASGVARFGCSPASGPVRQCHRAGIPAPAHAPPL